MHGKLDLRLEDLRVRTFQVDPGAAGENRGTVHALCEPDSDCAHCSRCSDCTGCSDCSYCSDCTGCSGCTGCSDCTGCSAWTGETCGLGTWY